MSDPIYVSKSDLYVGEGTRYYQENSTRAILIALLPYGQSKMLLSLFSKDI